MRTNPLTLIPNEPEARVRVCGIVFTKNHEHENRCIRALRNREHPPWSSSFSDFRVTVKLRRV
jgi:hypothetical protein